VMFGELMMRGSRLHKNLKKARRLWDSFLAFQDHYWFSEVTRSRQGTELYRHYQEALDVNALHRQMSSQVHELQDHYEGKFERRLGRLMNLLTFIGLPTTLVVTLFGRFIVSEHIHKSHALMCSVAIYFAFFVLWCVWTYYIPE
jgi:Mg2+ and Co2+ transporter CorA